MHNDLDDILDRVKRVTGPSSMSVSEALEFVQELIGELEMMEDALKLDGDKE